MKHHKIPKISNRIISFLVLFFVALLLVLSIVLVRIKLLQNAQDLGMALTESYALEEEVNITNLQRIAQLASQYVEEINAGGGTGQEIQSWLQGYFVKMTDILGENVVDPYAVINGEIIGANPWSGDDDCDFGSTEWYTKAIEARGEVVCSEVYTDAITGKLVMTISKALETPGDVMAMDVYIENPTLHNSALAMPEKYSYYLCTGDGELIYAKTPWQRDQSHDRENARYLLEGIQNGSLLKYDATFTDYVGDERGTYFHQMSNGWVVIMTIPFNLILLGEENVFIYVITFIAAVMFVLLGALTIRDTIQDYRMKKADDTIHMLGDSFYAIFRVNFEKESYEAIKLKEEEGATLPQRGSYSELMEYIRKFVKFSTYQEFEQSFSLAEIQRRVDKGIADYGGDYQRRFGDTYRWVNIRTLYDKNIAKDEVTLCFRDVDAERRQQMQHMILLQDALEAARKSTKAKSNFFNSMSHDMRTPLNAIIGYCGLAQKSQESGDTAKVQDYIRKIDFAGNQLLTLINDILELSRMEAGKDNLQQAEFDLKELLENNAEIFHDQAQAAGKTFTYSLDLTDTRVVGDSKKISQVINNLLSNAIKYSNPGDSIRLEARQFDFQQHSKYQFVVQDTGIGMSPRFLEHLFEPYSRETAFTVHPTVGTGLGMPIVKSLVQQMSGEISVESALGQGSKFTVTLPLEAVKTQTGGPAAAVRPQREQPFDWSGWKVLLAEDNELNMEIATEILTMCGAEVLSASNGAEAVHLFSAAAPYSIGVILMDMQMPEMDGCEAARIIRSMNRPDAQWVPIIAVTANAFAEDIDRTTKAGMNGHVSKPIDFHLLGQVLQKAIQERDGDAPASKG